MAQLNNPAGLTAEKPKISVFIPLQLDSAFDGINYKYGNILPKNLSTALEFYNGVKIAADELQKEGVKAKIRVYDTKEQNFLTHFFSDSAKGSTGIVIAAPQSAGELKTIAEKLRPYKIPLISILPNDAGINGYPEFVIANSTLGVHCQQLFQFVQSKHTLDNIILLSPSGSAETRLKQNLKEANQKTKGIVLKWKEVEMGRLFSVDSLEKYMDTTRQNVIISPTLNTQNAQQLVKLAALANKGSFRMTIFGMPTWETIAFNKPEYKGVDIWYGTPFLTLEGNAFATEQFTKQYRELTNSTPGDMAFRGYEMTIRFVKTFVAYGPDFLKYVNSARFRVFNDFQFKPVNLRENGQIDYLENQKIYFVKKEDGIVKTVQTP